MDGGVDDAQTAPSLGGRRGTSFPVRKAHPGDGHVRAAPDPQEVIVRKAAVDLGADEALDRQPLAKPSFPSISISSSRLISAVRVMVTSLVVSAFGCDRSFEFRFGRHAVGSAPGVHDHTAQQTDARRGGSPKRDRRPASAVAAPCRVLTLRSSRRTHATEAGNPVAPEGSFVSLRQCRQYRHFNPVGPKDAL